MSVLITGATGFIGLNIAEALLSRGETVVLFSRRSIRPDADSMRKPTPPGAYGALSTMKGILQIVTGDVRDKDAVERMFAEFTPDSCIHGAAVTPGLTRERDQMQLTADVNFMGTLNVLEAARNHPLDRFIYLSSGAVYGLNSFHSDTLDEETAIPIPDTIYAISKYAAERASLRYRKLWSMRVIAARLGTVFGPWEWDTGIRASLSTILLTTACAVQGRQAILPRILGHKDWVYSRDVSGAILALLDTPEPAHDVYNLGSGHLWTVWDWCEKLADFFPNFTYRVTDINNEVNCHYSTPDRAPLSIRRLEEDTGFRASFGLNEAFDDYMQWIKNTPDFWET